MQCKEIRSHLDAYLDTELDAGTKQAVETHVASCALCRAELRSLRHLQYTLRDQGRWPMPEGLEDDLRQSLGLPVTTTEPPAPPVAPPPARTDWRGFLAGIAAGLLLGVVIYLTALQPTHNAGTLAEEVVRLHVQSQLADHLVDVASSDRHQVKPWFQGRIDYTVPVNNLADEGFALLGGRLDYLDNRNVAALAFQHRQHRINLFIWPATATVTLPDEIHRRGYNLVVRASGGLTFVAISDMNRKGLETFLRRYLELSA